MFEDHLSSSEFKLQTSSILRFWYNYENKLQIFLVKDSNLLIPESWPNGYLVRTCKLLAESYKAMHRLASLFQKLASSYKLTIRLASSYKLTIRLASSYKLTNRLTTLLQVNHSTCKFLQVNHSACKFLQVNKSTYNALTSWPFDLQVTYKLTILTHTLPTPRAHKHARTQTYMHTYTRT